jgi:Transposase DDE domain
MRHGRKTKRVRVDGYKRHVLTDLDTELAVAVEVTAANVAEAEVAAQIAADLDAQGPTLAELHLDRAYLASALVRDGPRTWRSSARRSRSATGPAWPSPRITWTSTTAC